VAEFKAEFRDVSTSLDMTGLSTEVGASVIRFIYNLFWPIGLLFFLPGYFVKMIRRGGYREKFGQRLGIYDRDVQARLSQQRATWLHAVSVGEVNVALKVAAALRALEPDLRCALTTTTTTGFALARKSAPPWIEVMYTPLDYWPITRRAFSVIRPARILLVEAEVWPNLVAFAHARRIPVALVNARLSPRSERRYRQFRFFVAPTFRLLDLVCVPEPQDISRWTALGVPRSRIHATGSIKYDPGARGSHEAAAMSLGNVFPALSPERLVLFGGSTHSGEEEILAKVFLRLRKQFPSLRLFIAPRHVERLREIRAHLACLPLRVALASKTFAVRGFGDADCVLLDTTGELQRWYALATVVFIGKSLTARGGQNPVEPIVAGKPVVFGPHMENFATLAEELVSKQGAIRVSDADSLQRAIEELLREEQARRLVENAREVLDHHRGATARTAALIHELRSTQQQASVVCGQPAAP
jgi:3-deoxy-D-manno-octulosonic-acid transferase